MEQHWDNVRRQGVLPRPNWKAECAETCLLRLERGKGCKALPIATLPWALGKPACGETSAGVSIGTRETGFTETGTTESARLDPF
jgi:hypothetical protein